MSAITSANVTMLKSWEGISKGNKTSRSYRRAQVTLSAQGGTSGDIPASVFNLVDIYEVDAYGLNATGTWSSMPVVLDQTTNGTTGAVLNTGILTCSPSTGALANATGILEVLVTGRSI
jgi:hypothetical protein